MNEICTCPICFLPYDQVIPVVASCGHSLCRDCSTAIAAIHIKGIYQCPICEGESSIPLPKNLELINLLEFLHLQLDISTPRTISILEPNDIPKEKAEEILLQQETSVLHNTTIKGNPAILKVCLYPGKFQYDMEVELLKKLSHPNIIQFLAYCDTSLVFEHTANGKLSTHFHCLTKREVIPLLLTKEARLKVAIDVIKAVLYIQSQRKDVNFVLEEKFGTSMPLLLSQTLKISDHILLDSNYNAKLMLMPAGFSPLENKTLLLLDNTKVVDCNMSTDDMDGDDTSDKPVPQHQEMVDIRLVGFFLLELLLNQPMESFAAMLVVVPSQNADVAAFIQPQNDIMSQYYTEGPHTNEQVDSLFVNPLFSLALVCLDDVKNTLCPISARQVLLQLLHIRQTLLASTPLPLPPPSPLTQEEQTSSVPANKSKSKNILKKKQATSDGERRKKVLSTTTRNIQAHQAEETTSKATSSSIKSKNHPHTTKASPSPALSPSQTPRPPPPPRTKSKQSTSRTNKKCHHHPGFFCDRPCTIGGRVIAPSWRCCGRASATAMGCVYDTPSHHPGKWVPRRRLPRPSHDELELDSSSTRSVINSSSGTSLTAQLPAGGVFDCCSGRIGSHQQQQQQSCPPAAAALEDRGDARGMRARKEDRRSSSDDVEEGAGAGAGAGGERKRAGGGGCTAGLQPKPFR
jgi:hypothetical protein